MRTEPDPLDEQERYLIEQIEAIKREYELAAKPYVDRLILIRSLRPQPTILVTLDQARAAGILVTDL